MRMPCTRRPWAALVSQFCRSGWSGPDIQRGALSIALSGYQVSRTALDTNICVVFPHNRHLSAKVRALIDFPRQRFGPRPYWEVDDHACATARLEAVNS